MSGNSVRACNDPACARSSPGRGWREWRRRPTGAVPCGGSGVGGCLGSSARPPAAARTVLPILTPPAGFRAQGIWGSRPGSSKSGGGNRYSWHPHDTILFGVGFSLDANMSIDALAPGCSADKSGSVQVGDYVVAVDGKSDLSPTQAKEMILGRQGTYTTISFRRPEGANVRTFKVQLMRGSADYIFLVECLRGLEHQIAELQAENETLRNGAQAPPQSNDSDRLRARLEELQAENQHLRNRHRDEIEGLLGRIEEIEMRERQAPPSPEPMSLKKEQKKVQRSAAPPPLPMPETQMPEPEPMSLKKEQKKVQRSAAPPPQKPEPEPEPEPAFEIRRERKKVQRSAAPPPAATPPQRPTPDRSPQRSAPMRSPAAISAPRPRGPGMSPMSPSYYVSDPYMGGYYPSPPEAMFSRAPPEIPGTRETFIAHPFKVGGRLMGPGAGNLRGDLE